MAWYCYLLRNGYPDHVRRTYCGCTNDPKRRLRQHNGELVGGAKYTTAFGNKQWEIYALIIGFPDYRNALQCEWIIKHPDRKIKSAAKYRRPSGRITALNKVLHYDKWTSNSLHENKDLNLKVWIIPEFSDKLVDISDNIEVIITDDIINNFE